MCAYTCARTRRCGRASHVGSRSVQRQGDETFRYSRVNEHLSTTRWQRDVNLTPSAVLVPRIHGEKANFVSSEASRAKVTPVVLRRMRRLRDVKILLRRIARQHPRIASVCGELPKNSEFSDRRDRQIRTTRIRKQREGLR